MSTVPNIDPETELGHCDVCHRPFNLASFMDHCPEDGNCWKHCENYDGHREIVKKHWISIGIDASAFDNFDPRSN